MTDIVKNVHKLLIINLLYEQKNAWYILCVNVTTYHLKTFIVF